MTRRTDAIVARRYATTMNATIEQRIVQWETMVREAPDDMAWLSLGNAYKEAERLEDAVDAYAQAIALNDAMSRAYQLRGQCLIKMGREDEAADVLTRGYVSATERGDVMPQKAMAVLLEQLGKPLPEVKKAELPPEVQSGEMVIDRRTGKPGPRLPDPPMRGPIGAFIFDHFSHETWREWIAMGTKVINELRLDFSIDEHQKVYEDHMLEWLGVTREEIDQYAEQMKS